MKNNARYRLNKTNWMFSSLPRSMYEQVGDRVFTLLEHTHVSPEFISITILCNDDRLNFVVRNESWKKHVVEVAGLLLSGTYMKGTPGNINIPIELQFMFGSLPSKLFIHVQEITKSHLTISFPDSDINGSFRVSHIDFQAMFAFVSTERKDQLGNRIFGVPDSAKIIGIQPRGDIWSKGYVFSPSATSVKVEFEFKTDQDRLDAIKFLTNMKMN